MATITTSTTGVDIDYIDKDYSSVEDALINFATIQFGPGTSANRLWTDFNLSSFSRNWLDIVAYVSDVFFFYFDVQATQAYLQTATINSAVQDIADQFGFVPATASSSSGLATLTFNAAGTVPRGSRLQATSGVQFFTTTATVASVAGNYSVNVLQGQLNTENFVSVGLQNEQLNLKSQNIVVDQTNSNPLDITPQVTVNGNTYTLVSTFILSNGTDTPPVLDVTGAVIGGGGRVFELNQRADGTQYVEFGDGTFGRQLQPNETVVVSYRSGGGSVGDIPAQTLTTLLDTYPFVNSVTNAAAFTGGTDAQTIPQLQQLIPASLRTLERAVTDQDYADILLANFPQVQLASAEQNTTQPGIDVNVYVVPSGATITPITANVPLLSSLTSFLDLRKMVTVQFQILNANGIDFLVTLEVHITNTSSQSAVKANIITVLQNYFNLQTGGPTGTGLGFQADVLIEDISTLIKGVTGISRFEFRKFTYRPVIDPNIIGLTTAYDYSDVDIFPNVTESEWLIGAAGPVEETTGTVLVHNNSVSPFTYNSTTGLITYTSTLLPENLNSVAPGDEFRDGAAANFVILGVNSSANTLYIGTSLTVNTTPGANAGGSIRSGASTSNSFKVFKKTNAIASNLSINSITDDTLDFSVEMGIGVVLAPNVLLDNTQVYIPGQYATGSFYLEDSASNIWEILANDSDTITTSITAVNDASVTSVTAGSYRIVTKLTGEQVLFVNNIFTINYNNHNTIFSIGAQFSNIGTIGNSFQISKTQANIGTLGVAVNLINYDSSTGVVELNNQPDLSGVTANDFLVDSSGQVFRITGTDNRLQPETSYDSTHQNTSVILTGTGTNSKFAQGFQVSQNALYPTVSFNLERQGNITGNLTATIVNDVGGLPNLASPVTNGVSNPLAVTSISTTFSKTVFTFTTPPSLVSGTQYHLVLSGDAGYISTQKNNVVNFDNDAAATAYTYNSTNGIVQYASPVGLSSVVPGNFVKDRVGNLFQVLAVTPANNTVTIATGATFIQDSPTFSGTPGSGSIYANDNVYVGIDTAGHVYPSGVFDTYNGSTWAHYSPTADAIFSVEGPNSVIINSNLTPVLGAGGTISSRYYDDNDEVSFILGVSGGQVTYATDVNALGLGTVSSIPNSAVDSFVFRTSPYIDDIINLRGNEIPQLQVSDITINIFGGIP